VLDEYPTNDILVDLKAKCVRDLLGNLAAAHAGVASFHLDDRVDEFPGGTFGSGPPALSRAVEQAILALHQGAVEVQQGGGLQYHSHLAHAFG
jgi:hypothetical protein